MAEDDTVKGPNSTKRHISSIGLQSNESIQSRSHGASLFQRAIFVCGIVFLAVLSLASIVITVEGSSAATNDRIIVTSNHILPVLIGTLIWTIILVVFYRFFSIKNVKAVAYTGFFLATSLSVIWVFISDSGPSYDSMELSCAAWAMTDPKYVPLSMTEWRSHGEYVWGIGWEEPVPSQQSYMGKFPFQSPFVILLMLCQRLGGSNFALLYQLINAIANGLIWYHVIMIAYDITREINSAIIALGICLLYNPIIYFSTFIYGNTLSLAFALIAWHLIFKAFDDEQRGLRRLLALTFAIICLVIAVLVKQTLILVSIAFAVTIITYCINRRDVRFIPIIVIPFIISSSISNVIVNHFEEITGSNLHDAPPKLSWIVMGIGGGREFQATRDNNPEISNDLAQPGYFDFYVAINPPLEGYDSWDEMNRFFLKKRLEHFQRDPNLMFAFFCKKLAIEWLEPTAECFIVSNYNREPDFATYLADTNRVYTRYARTFYYGKMNKLSILFGDCAQSIIAIGALIWTISSFIDKDKDYSIYLLGLILILGGAFLYIFWENKTQYILPFWAFMMPYAASGWLKLVSNVCLVMQSRKAD